VQGYEFLAKAYEDGDEYMFSGSVAARTRREAWSA